MRRRGGRGRRSQRRQERVAHRSRAGFRAGDGRGVGGAGRVGETLGAVRREGSFREHLEILVLVRVRHEHARRDERRFHDDHRRRLVHDHGRRECRRRRGGGLGGDGRIFADGRRGGSGGGGGFLRRRRLLVFAPRVFLFVSTSLLALLGAFLQFLLRRRRRRRVELGERARRAELVRARHEGGWRGGFDFFLTRKLLVRVRVFVVPDARVRRRGSEPVIRRDARASDARLGF